jgi:mono/diheme cytochrome c family protein
MRSTRSIQRKKREAMKNTRTNSLAALLASLTLAACGPAGTADAPPDRNLDPVQVGRGQAVYEQNCAVCHGPEGQGQSGDWRVREADGRFSPPPLDDSAHAWHHPTADLR